MNANVGNEVVAAIMPAVRIRPPVPWCGSYMMRHFQRTHDFALRPCHRTEQPLLFVDPDPSVSLSVFAYPTVAPG